MDDFHQISPPAVKHGTVADTLLWDLTNAIIEHGEETVSLLISTIEAARRGSFNISRAHALEARKALIELLRATNSAADIEFKARIEGDRQNG